ncbi:hypothetical protein VPH35_002902 [Triticum aestivum]
MPPPAVDREPGARAPLPELQQPRSVQPRRPPGPLLLLCFLLPPLPISSSLTHLHLSQVRHEQRHGWAPPADAKSPPWPPFVLIAAFRIPAGSASSASPSCRSPSTSTTYRHGPAPPPEMPRPPPEPAKKTSSSRAALSFPVLSSRTSSPFSPPHSPEPLSLSLSLSLSLCPQEYATAAGIFSPSLLVGSSRPCFQPRLSMPKNGGHLPRRTPSVPCAHVAEVHRATGVSLNLPMSFCFRNEQSASAARADPFQIDRTCLGRPRLGPAGGLPAPPLTGLGPW